MWRAVVVVVFLSVPVGCGGGDDGDSASSTTASAPATTTTTVAAAPGPNSQVEVTTMWQNFFTESVPLEEKIRHIENGEAHRPEIEQMAASGQTKGVTATVGNVAVNPATRRATVGYSIYLNGQPVVPNVTGEAVFQDGTWKMSENVFCVLISLSGSSPPSCAGKT